MFCHAIASFFLVKYLWYYKIHFGKKVTFSLANEICFYESCTGPFFGFDFWMAPSAFMSSGQRPNPAPSVHAAPYAISHTFFPALKLNIELRSPHAPRKKAAWHAML